jgi:hypothetical protein
VSFEEGATVLGTAILDGTGHAALTLSLPAGTHSIIARYLGEGSFEPSESVVLVQAVTAAATADIPTLNVWMLALLAAAMAVVALRMFGR